MLAAILAAAAMNAAALPADLAKAAHDYDLAQMHGDKAELTRLLAEDYRLFNSGGQVQDKAAFIADSTAPGFHMEPFTVEEPLEKVMGDTALLGGVATLKGTDGGKPFTARLRFMDVWAKRGGAWKVVFTQATRVPAA
ncbi:nuclear transport factor 2 family protein [Phenylobacterium sp.]|uniref:nuclear transport factor 2 family protein n=1 Tax=Phenylobacterium sp. TaxID=1871053 RepID=UPI0035663473